jgi:hypothetical protein
MAESNQTSLRKDNTVSGPILLSKNESAPVDPTFDVGST